MLRLVNYWTDIIAPAVCYACLDLYTVAFLLVTDFPYVVRLRDVAALQSLDVPVCWRYALPAFVFLLPNWPSTRCCYGSPTRLAGATTSSQHLFITWFLTRSAACLLRSLQNGDDGATLTAFFLRLLDVGACGLVGSPLFAGRPSSFAVYCFRVSGSDRIPPRTAVCRTLLPRFTAFVPWAFWQTRHYLPCKTFLPDHTCPSRFGPCGRGASQTLC